MSINIDPSACPLTLQPEFVQTLQAALERVASSDMDTSSGIVINFRDPTYSAESGGYHPVEVAIDADGGLVYVTDFAYFGPPKFAELGKEMDFDFSLGLFQHYGRDFPLQYGDELFQIYQANFASYAAGGVYAVTVAPLG